MNINDIPFISVSYNSVELIDDLLRSVRSFYSNPITIIDGSSADLFQEIEAVCNNYSNVSFIHFDYNIHHGPGMAWAFQNLELSGPVLVLDSDIFVLKAGFLESMCSALTPEMYGVGSVSYVNEGGYDVESSADAIRYLHPACMLCNIEVVRDWPMPIKHGAPMTETMLAIHRAGRHELIGNIEWLNADFSKTPAQNYLRHDWQGTVKRTGGYHLEEWEKAAQEAAKVRLLTLSLLPPAANNLVEMGANDGALARAYKVSNSACRYISIVTDPKSASLEKGARDEVKLEDVNALSSDFFTSLAKADGWVLDQVLERMLNPELLLTSIRKVIGKDGCVVAVIPNAQHWSIQAKLCIGDFRYEDTGLLQKSHLRWFTRATIFELFQRTGFQVVQGYPVVHSTIENPKLISAIRQFSESVGANPDLAIEDAQAVQYIVKAVPV